MSGGGGSDRRRDALLADPADPSAAAAHAAAAWYFVAAVVPILLLLVLAKVIAMSTKKKASAANFKMDATPKRVKKVRSISVSVDLEGYESARAKYHNYFTRSTPGEDHRFRTISATVTAGEKDYIMRRINFPFQDLPDDCQLKIFQFLKPEERGVAAQVCKQWSALMKSSSLWGTVDFTQFPLCNKSHDCGKSCYTKYRKRIKQFIEYLQIVKPGVKRLRFAFDIDDHEDGWLESIETFLKAARLQELEFVHMNWAETPVKPYWGDSNITWTAGDFNALKFKNRHRQRRFVNFFDKFTAAAPNIRKLMLPFDWSERSLKALGRLHELHTLVLGKYFENQQLAQEQVDTLLTTVSGRVRKLILEVWTPSGKGLSLYSLRAPNLPYVDIKLCRGFYLRELDLPSCTVFKVGPCHPLKGSLACTDDVAVPCIYQLLLTGAPRLRQLNEHRLLPQWRWRIYPELDILLNAVCPCRKHKKDP